MSATVIQTNSAAGFKEMKPACRMLILHDDLAAYGRAASVCRHVMEQFAREFEFDIKCWNFIELADADCGRHAAKAAGVADIILLSLATSGLPAEFEGWLDAFFPTRFKENGALTLVLDEADGSAAALEKLLLRLHLLAGRLGMDFVPLLAENKAAVADILPVQDWPLAARLPENLDLPASDHWGLNE
jgi:hypothetical protein